MPPKKGGKKGGNKPKSTTQQTAAITRAEETVVEEKIIPGYLKDGYTQKDRDVVIRGYYMYTPDGRTELLKNATLRLVYGRRYGLIGQNGIGKSTLLRAISNYTIPDFPNNLRVVHVQQEEIPREDQKKSVLSYVLGSDEQKNYLEAEEARLLDLLETGDDDDNMADFDEVQEQLDRVYTRLEDIGARSAESRVRAILNGLQFTPEMQEGPINALSGGWRMRVRLACALFVIPDILLLDEPTNHLDFPAVEWLASFLRQYEPTLLVVSHDRGFLDQVMTDCIDFRDQTLMYYRGDYTNYLQVRADFIRTHNRLVDKTEKKRQALMKFINEARQNALDDPNLAEMAKQRQRILDNLPVLEPIREDRSISFSFPDPGQLDQDIIQCYDMSFHYDPEVDGVNKPFLLNKINCNVDMKSRIGVMGANGAGKTTLINVLLGKYEPSKGKVKLNDHARCRIFTQHHLDLLDETKSPLEFMMSQFKDAKEGQMRGFLGRFGMDKRLAEQRIGSLSGGQKSRVSFALLTYQQPHLVIMDEPTNHLDIETIESLIQALKSFGGAVIVISHDRYFLSQIAEEFWAVDAQGHMEKFYDLDEAKDFSYKKLVYDGPVQKKVKQKKKQETEEVVNHEDVRLKQLQEALDDDDDDDDEENILQKMDAKASVLSRLVAASDAGKPKGPSEPYVYVEEKATRQLNLGRKETFSFADLMEDTEEEEEEEEEYVPVPVVAPKKAAAKKAKKKAAKKAVFDDDDDDEDTLAALAALNIDEDAEEETAPAPKKKAGKKKAGKKAAANDDDDDEDFAALAALAGEDDEEDVPAPKKKVTKKKAGKKAAANDDDDDEDFAALAALAGEDDEDVPAPKKKVTKKKAAKKAANDDDDDEDFAALAALAGEDDDEAPAPKKKVTKKKAAKKVEEDDDDDFAALAALAGEDDDEAPAPKKKVTKKKATKKAANDDDDDDDFAALAALAAEDDDEAPAPKKKAGKKKATKKAANDDDDDDDFAALAALAAEDDDDAPVGKKAARGRNK